MFLKICFTLCCFLFVFAEYKVHAYNRNGLCAVGFMDDHYPIRSAFSLLNQVRVREVCFCSMLLLHLFCSSLLRVLLLPLLLGASYKIGFFLLSQCWLLLLILYYYIINYIWRLPFLSRK